MKGRRAGRDRGPFSVTVDGVRVVYRVGADMVLGARKERKKRAKADALARRRELLGRGIARERPARTSWRSNCRLRTMTKA